MNHATEERMKFTYESASQWSRIIDPPFIATNMVYDTAQVADQPLIVIAKPATAAAENLRAGFPRLHTPPTDRP
jgi:hypothetical protein